MGRRRLWLRRGGVRVGDRQVARQGTPARTRTPRPSKTQNPLSQPLECEGVERKECRQHFLRVIFCGNQVEIFRMTLSVEVLQKPREECTTAPREGAYIHGLYMEGARWDINGGVIAESLPKELTPIMPLLYIKAIPVDKKETKDVYECPRYRTRQRGPTYIWTFSLKTKKKT